MAIQNAQLKNEQLDVLQANKSANQTLAITSIMVCNTYSPSGASPGTNTANFDMHILKDNQQLDVQVTCVIRELVLPAGETFTFDGEKVVLGPGEKLSFVARPGVYNDPNGDPGNTDLTNLSVMVSYLEV